MQIFNHTHSQLIQVAHNCQWLLTKHIINATLIKEGHIWGQSFECFNVLTRHHFIIHHYWVDWGEVSVCNNITEDTIWTQLFVITPTSLSADRRDFMTRDNCLTVWCWHTSYWRERESVLSWEREGLTQLTIVNYNRFNSFTSCHQQPDTAS